MKTFLFAILAVAAMASAKDREWKIGRVLDTIPTKGPDVTTSTTHAEVKADAINYGSATTATARGTATTRTVSESERRREIYVLGDGYLYTLEDPQGPPKSAVVIGGLLGGNPNTVKRRPCRLVIGEDVKFSQDRNTLHILDADGRKCSASVVLQRKQ